MCNSVSRRLALVPVLASVTLFSSAALARPDGSITNRTEATSAGCGSCHGSRNTATTVTIAGPAEVEKGSSTEYVVTVAGAGSAAGVDIKASEGTIVPVGNTLKTNANGELTHSQPTAGLNGRTEFRLTFQAPNEDVALLFTAVGNSVNGDGQQSGDQWNFATPLTVRVGNPTEGPAPTVDEEETDNGGCSVGAGMPLALAALGLAGLLRRRRS